MSLRNFDRKTIPIGSISLRRRGSWRKGVVTSQLTRIILSFFLSFSSSPSSSSSSSSSSPLPVAGRNLNYLWYSLDFSSRYAVISTSLSPAQPAFGRASLPVSDFFLRFSMDFSSQYTLCSMYGYLWWIDTV
jgi:hypothetical protein